MEVTPSSGGSLETSQSSGSELAAGFLTTPSGQYDPRIYKCVDVEEDYVYFEGTPGSEHDQRFTIDLEHGTTDR